ncbi:hypothetical protein ABT263_31470 [Kitasatospora sp. NPDC001603]|uniref:hypothetical protein n=1 Tax=Kitasatospora sp. NPDC001603 TaxID=3154388 RepID=UPI00332EF987
MSTPEITAPERAALARILQDALGPPAPAAHTGHHRCAVDAVEVALAVLDSRSRSVTAK